MKKVFKCLTLISQLGFSMLAPVILCTILGVYLEEQFSVSVTIPLIVVGVLAGGRNVYDLLKHTSKEITSEEECINEEE